MNKFEEDVRAYVADRRARMNEIAEGKIDFRDRSDALRWLDRFAYANMIIINFAESVGMIDEEAAKVFGPKAITRASARKEG